MKHNLSSQIARMCVSSLICLIISTLAVAANQPSAVVPPALVIIIPVLNAKAQAVDAALADMRASLKVAADLQAAMEKETGRKGQAEVATEANQKARKAAEQNLSNLKSRLAAAEKELTALDKQKKSIAKLQKN